MTFLTLLSLPSVLKTRAVHGVAVSTTTVPWRSSPTQSLEIYYILTVSRAVRNNLLFATFAICTVSVFASFRWRHIQTLSYATWQIKSLYIFNSLCPLLYCDEV